MGTLTDAQFDLAEAKGQETLLVEPRASLVRYDHVTKRVVIDLINGCSYAFPVHFVQDLQNASEDDLADIQVDGVGFNLHWPKLDVDLYVPALVSGIFGTRAWMTRELARIAGKAISPAKSAAARANGAKGGRPRKIASG